MTRSSVLVVCAVAAERDALAAAGVTARVGGVGPVAAAAATATALARGSYDLVLSVGIGGGFAPLSPGDVAVAAGSAFADLGAESPHGFLELPIATVRYPIAADLAHDLAARTGGRLGTILTVATVTGTAATAQARLARFPDAVAEGMEGAGVAAAATAAGVAFGELRAISNPVGPRDRDAWQLPLALAALGRAVASAVL